MNWLLIRNTTLVGGATTALSVTLGTMAAMFLRGLTGRARQGVITFAIIALALPPFLVTNCWLHYLGAGGAWRSWLPFNIFSPGGTVWILVLLTWPISLIFCESALKHLDAPLLESDPVVSDWGLIWRVVVPMLRRAMGLAAVVTFVLAANNFSVPAILQVKVLPAEAWLRFNTELDSKGSLLMSLPLVLIALVLAGALAARTGEWRRVSQADDGRVFRRQLGRRWFWYCGAVTVFLCVVSVGIPLFQLASLKRTWTEMPSAIAAGKVAIGNSFVLSAVAATLVITSGVAISIKCLGEQRRFIRTFGQILWLPFLAPGVLIGIGLIAVFDRPILSAFYQSSGVMLLAYTIRYLALGWNGAAHAFRSVDRDLVDAARLEGATTGELFRVVHWPQIAAQLAAAWYVVFLLCLWDVESIILVIPPGGQTLATTIFNLLHYGYNAQVNALCFTLLVVALAPLLIWKTWNGAWRAFQRIGA
jgi:iron(III) transport system permease protein